MDEISNKTLATLLVVAIVISLAGTFFAMRGTQVLSQTISGYQTSAPTGTTLVNISETLEITLNQSTVDFGTGYRDPGQIDNDRLCNLSSGEPLPESPACWHNLTAYEPLDFLLENSGTIDVNVTINSSLAENFVNQDPATGMYLSSLWPNYSWTGQHVIGDDGCTGDTNLTEDEIFFDETEQTLCHQFMSDDNQDDLNVSIILRIPAGPSGNKSAVVTFTARKFLGD